MLKIKREVMSKSTKIPTDILLEVINSDVFKVVLENNYDFTSEEQDIFITAGVDLSSAINFYTFSALARPVFSQVSTDSGVFNPMESIVLEINNTYYDILNNKSGLKDKPVNVFCSTGVKLFITEKAHILRKEIKKIYIENYINSK